MRLVLDSLRYWVQEMHVDGFRFDLARTLARGQPRCRSPASFLDAVYQDPVLSQRQAHRRAVGPRRGGYQVGGFPSPWSEWNDRFRDDVRRYWRGDESTHARDGLTAYRQPDLFAPANASPQASINYVTATTASRCTTSSATTRSTTWRTARRTATAPTTTCRGTSASRARRTTRRSLATREQQKRNLLATLLFSQGVPMISGGDEIGRTQRRQQQRLLPGQRDKLVRLELRPRDHELLEFVRRLTGMRDDTRRCGAAASSLGARSVDRVKTSRGCVRTGEMTDGSGRPWISASACLDGKSMSWTRRPADRRCVLLFLQRREHALDFVLPDPVWTLVLDTARPDIPDGEVTDVPGIRIR